MVGMLRCFLVLIFAAYLAACDPPPEFSATLGDPGQLFDDRLEGDWLSDRGRNGANKPEMIFYARIKPRTFDRKKSETADGVSKVSILEATFIYVGNGDESVIKLQAHPTTINGQVFYNVQWLGAYSRERWVGPRLDNSGPGGKRGYMILRPVFLNDDILAICGLLWPHGNNSKGRLKRDLEKLGFKGRIVQENKYWDRTFVETDREELRAILRRSDISNLFPAMLFFAVTVRMFR